MMTDLIVARFFRGPFDQRTLVLPCNPPWPRFVIPRWDNPIELEVFYLLAGELDEDVFAYLWDDAYSSVTSPA